MALALTIVLFLTIALVVFSFGAAAYAPSSVLGSRLRALGWQRTQGSRKNPRLRNAWNRRSIRSARPCRCRPARSRAPAVADPGRLPGTAPLDDVCRAAAWCSQCSAWYLVVAVAADSRSAVLIGQRGRVGLLSAPVHAQAHDSGPPAAHQAGFAGCARPHRDLRRSRTGPRSGPDAGRPGLAACPSRI